MMQTDTETKYCQTCGIPLDIDYNNLGANTSTEYCDYCLKHGVKGYDFSMDYLIYLWGLFPEEYYKEVGISYTSSEIRDIMSRRLPEIKRWKQKINTAHVLYELVVRNACPEGKHPVQIVPRIEKVPSIRIACLKLEWTEHINHDFSVLWKQQ